ncbi:MAG: hypothetical protein H7315_21710 [Herminiimonas sp.]|nr:hypothetical protein [Herminiimonas sp.]
MSDLPLKLDGLTFEVFEISASADTINASADAFGTSFSDQQDRIFETLMSFQDGDDIALASTPDTPAHMLESAVHMIRAVFRIDTPMYQ